MKEVEEKIEALKIEDVMSVYNGKDGRACGCNGNHRYASAYREAAGIDRGYEISDEDVNDKHVRKIVKFFKENAELAEYSSSSFGEHFSIVKDKKLYVLYLYPGDEVIEQTKIERAERQRKQAEEGVRKAREAVEMDFGAGI